MKGKNDIKCCACGRKLAEAQLTNGWVNIRCKCGVDNLISATRDKVPEKVEAPNFIGIRGLNTDYIASRQRIEIK